ncbi:DEAD/DEAH box helicase, partial [Candidatus Pacearchaeota archaeon]
MKFLKNIIPREYQQKIFETCIEKNCLVILPTGLGKTLIALMLTIERMIKFPGEKVVFLAPTKPLAEQHLIFFREHLEELFAEVQLFTGAINSHQRKNIWETADIIFSTPQCIANDLKKGLYNLQKVCLLIEDEAHRCVKNYDYNFIAKQYKKQSNHPRILGLTASPGSDSSKIKEICNNLSIETLEIRTRDSIDVKKYLQELEFKLEKVVFPSEFEEIRQLLKKIYEDYISELKLRNLLYDFPSKMNLIKLQRQLGKSCSSGNRHFNVLRGMSICANAIKLQHALELLETQTLQSFYAYLKELFRQSEKSKSKGIQQLTKKEEFILTYNKVIELIARGVEHPKVEKTEEIVTDTLSQNPKAKSIIFAQYRNTATQISKNLNKNNKIKAKVFVGQTKKSNAGINTGLSQKEQKQIIQDFSEGKINVLCATSIGEEGLDIPEVNKVIFYEPVPSEIRKIQRAGRTARVFPGELIILITKKTRDESFHWASFSREKKMYKIMKDIKNEL